MSYEHIEASPYWVLLVIPFKEAHIYDEAKITNVTQSIVDVSQNDALRDPVETNTPFFLHNRCISWSISSSKSQFTHSANFTIVSPVNNLNEISSNRTPNQDVSSKLQVGAYVMFWAMNSKEEYDKVKVKIRQNTPLDPPNYPQSGFKFMGRVESIRKEVSLNLDGAKMTRYSVTAHGFRELNNLIYYNQIVKTAVIESQSSQGLNFINALDLPTRINQLLTEGGIIVNTQDAIIALLDIFFDIDTARKIREVATDGGLSAPNREYLVPNRLVTLLGNNTNGQPAKYNRNVLTKVLGVVEREKNNTPTSIPTYRATASTDRPDIFTYGDTRKIATYIINQSSYFDSRPVWSLLQQYLAAPINEMYTAFRYTPATSMLPARIMPTLVARQTPFSSYFFDNKSEYKEYPITSYSGDMFRWKIPESHVLGYSIGNSDSLLVNYIHLLGFTDSPDVSTQVWLNEKENKPIMNVASIQRDGLRPTVHSTNIPLLQAAVNAQEAGFVDFNFFRALCADLMFDQHTKMSGTFNCVGIQDPICVGDNFEVIPDDPNAQRLLFHIEGITHEGGIYGNGEKTFRTTLHVSYGSLLDPKTDSTDSLGQTFEIPQPKHG